MTDERSTFETTKARLEDIVVQVRRKDVSLEQSLDMLEEAVRLVNRCNELIDQTSWKAPADEAVDAGVSDEDGDGAVVVVESVEAFDTDGDGVADVLEVVRTVDVDGDGLPDVVEVVRIADIDGDGVADAVLEVTALVTEDADGSEEREPTDEETEVPEFPDDERE